MPSNCSKLFMGLTLSLSLGLSACGPILDLLEPIGTLFDSDNEPVASDEPFDDDRPEPTNEPASNPVSSAAPLVSTEGVYAPQALVSTNTTPEKQSLSSTAGEVATIELSDGTQVQVPAVNDSFNLTLEKRSNTTALDLEGLQETGSMRVLNLQNLQLNTAYFPITIKFPAAEAGNINRDTLGVARVADVIVNGVLQKDHFTLLPAEVDSLGQVKAVDYLLPQSGDMKVLQAGALLTGIAVTKATLKYFLVTQQANLNWALAPQLLRMVPDQTLPEKRKLLEKLAGKERLKEEKKCVRNVIVLLHGHNEAEKDGYLGKPDVSAPWNFSYKRDVWTPLYDAYLKTPGLDAKSSCTAFYEYVYPSFRPAFDNLGPDLAAKIQAELQPLLANPDADPNLLIVAHSMGGLVARAGIQQFDAPLHKAFQRLLTWGTPHHGSILVSLSYVMNAGSDYSLLGRADADTSEILSRLVQNYVQIDAPGARDLRWDNARPLRLDEWFEPGATQPDNDALYSLTNGKRIYNTKLKALNETDIYGSPSGSGLKNKLGQLKYYFAYGRTDKTLTDSMIGIGATTARRLIKNPESIFDNNYRISENDGAVPVTSAGGEGLSAERERFTSIDHEELYGAARGPAVFDGESTFEQLSKGTEIANMTFGKLYFLNDAFAEYFGCNPYIKTISPDQGKPGEAVQIKGRCFNNADDKLLVYFNHQRAENITVKNCNLITVNAPDNLTSGEVMVVANGKESNGVQFTNNTQQQKDPCEKFSFPGVWSVEYTAPGVNVKTRLQVANDGTFQDDASSGTWEAFPDSAGGWSVSFVYNKGTTYSGHTQGSGCELKGRAYSGGGADLGGEWVGRR